MKCLIIDSDKKSLTALEKMLKETSQVKQIFTCSTPQQALDIAMENELDVIFCNFPKTGQNGIGFIENLPYPRPNLIVTSDKKEVAKDAFDHEAIDFLLKPVKNTRLMKSITRVIKHDGRRQAVIRNYDHLFAKIEGHYEKITTKDIYVIEGSADYLKIYTTEKMYTVYTTFKRVMENLSPKDFMRVHRSFVIRIDRISSIEDNTVKVEKHLVPVSNTFREALMDRLKIL